MIFAPSRISPRDANKFATTNMTNEIAAAINAMQPQYVVGHVPPRANFKYYFIASVVDSGPNDEDDFTDEQYWMMVQFISPDITANPLTLNDQYDPDNPPDDDNSPYGAANSILPVTNLNDLSTGGAPGAGPHTLAVGTLCLVYAFADVGAVGMPASGTNSATMDTPPNVHFVTSVFSLPFAQYGAMDFLSKTDHTWSAGFSELHESNEGV